jgi:16S rRNA (cytidine1402-2'-O)-methyltransferase
MAGTLYLVATPIGNLGDITYRAVEILERVQVIACEDTRHTHKLLQHYTIDTKTISYHEHNEQQRARQLIELLENGCDIAVVSDAGTPGISDPGFRLVQQAIIHDIAVVPVPGPSALIAALVVSGLSTAEFFFAGFLPARSSARKAKLREVCSINATLIFYEAPHRLAATLKDAYDVLGERRVVIARELTKVHEEIRRGLLSELVRTFSEQEQARGEFVLLIDGEQLAQVSGQPTDESISAAVARLENEGLDRRAALKKAAREMGLSRAEAYRRLVAERDRG